MRQQVPIIVLIAVFSFGLAACSGGTRSSDACPAAAQAPTGASGRTTATTPQSPDAVQAAIRARNSVLPADQQYAWPNGIATRHAVGLGGADEFIVIALTPIAGGTGVAEIQVSVTLTGRAGSVRDVARALMRKTGTNCIGAVVDATQQLTAETAATGAQEVRSIAPAATITAAPTVNPHTLPPVD
jgi:hypothetical protein